MISEIEQFEFDFLVNKQFRQTCLSLIQDMSPYFHSENLDIFEWMRNIMNSAIRGAVNPNCNAASNLLGALRIDPSWNLEDYPSQIIAFANMMERYRKNIGTIDFGNDTNWNSFLVGLVRKKEDLSNDVS